MTTLRFRFAPPVRPRALVSALALAAVLGMSACTTVEDTWDSTWDAVFGEDQSAATQTASAEEDGEEASDEEASASTEDAAPVDEASPPAEELVGSPEPRPYDDGATRRAPTVRHALVETPPDEVQVSEAPPPPEPPPSERIERQSQQAVSMTEASGDGLAEPPRSTPAQRMAAPSLTPPAQARQTPKPATPMQAQQSAPDRPMRLAAAGSGTAADGAPQGLLIAPSSGGGEAAAYGDEAVNGLGTTVIGGDGSVAIEPHVPVDYAGGYGGAGQTPQSMESVNPTGAEVSTLVATIQFGHGSTRLGSQDRAVLRQVVALQKEYGGALRVVGHASSRTANMSMDRHAMVNFTTSAERAEAVADALGRLGAPRDQIYTTAVSDNDPMYYEVMPSGEAGNRRAEVYLDY